MSVTAPWVERLAIALALLIIGASALLHLHRLSGSMPYPQHVDEAALLEASARVLQKGDLNPHLHAYPSLPVYLGTAGLALGSITASGQGKAVVSKKLGRVIAPFYEPARVVMVARTLWWAMGVISLLAVSVVALRLAGPVAMVLTALVGSAEAGLLSRAASYVNVDTPMTMFAMLCLALLSGSRDPRWSVRVLIPALLCGAALASKYTAFMLLLPTLLTQWLLHERDRGWACLAIIAGSVLSFVLFSPYVLLDLPHYVDGAAFENYHYRVRGHSGFDVEPGLSQLVAYANDLSAEFGWPLVAVSIVGVGTAVRRDWRLALVLLSYPVAVVTLLVGYKVHFVRNLLPVVALVPVFAACGLEAVWWLARAALRRAPRLAAGARADWAAAGIVALGLALAMPWWRIGEELRLGVDSRNELSAWTESNLPPATALVVPTQLPFDARTLPKNVALARLDLTNAPAVSEALHSGTLLVLPDWEIRSGWRGRRLATIKPGLAVIPPYDAIVHFGRKPVIPAERKDVCVDPSFQLVRIR